MHRGIECGPTGDPGEGVDDVIKDYKGRREICVKRQARRTGSPNGTPTGSTLPRDVVGGRVLPALISDHGLVHALILPGELQPIAQSIRRSVDTRADAINVAAGHSPAGW